MTKIANYFGDEDVIDFDHLPEHHSPRVDKDSIKDKLENKEEMGQLADQLIKMENYEGAKRIWKHVDVLDEMKTALAEKKKAASEEKYELAMKYRDEINQLKEDMLSESDVVELFEHNHTSKQLTLKNMLNQVLYRVDDSTAKYFIDKTLEKYDKIDSRDFDKKIECKRDAMIEALILLKVSKVGLEKYTKNCEELVPFLLKEISENLTILNEMKTQEEDVIDALKEEEKFTTFLKGIKALFQIMSNLHKSVELLDMIDTEFAMDIEVFCQELQQGLETSQKILKLLDEDLGISYRLMQPLKMENKILYDESVIEEGFSSIQRDKYNNMCSLCATFVSNGDEKDREKEELHLPERRLVFNNSSEEQQTYHNYCINLWINKINPNPN